MREHVERYMLAETWEDAIRGVVKVTPPFFGSQVSEAQLTSENGNLFPVLPIFQLLNSCYPSHHPTGALLLFGLRRRN